MATIAQNLAALRQAKSDIAAAITTKGGTVASGDGLSDFATGIGTIPTGVDTSQDTVTAEVLGEGYTAHNASGQLIVGTAEISPAPTSWEQLQTKVRNNDMNSIQIKDKVSCSKDSTTLSWDVIGKNQDTPSNPYYSNCLTLKTTYNYSSQGTYTSKTTWDFSGSEALYYCSSQLAAGTYHFKYDGTNYQFTLTNSVPVGGQFSFKNSAVTTNTIETYSSGSSTTPIESVPTSNGTNGTDLGIVLDNDINGNFNALRRMLYGTNYWKDSAIRQWLNSNKPSGQWWTPQNKWDRPPNYATTENGFMYNLDPEFIKVLGLVNKKTLKPLTDGGGTEVTSDIFFLPSQTEVYGGNQISGISEGEAYSFYSQYSSLSAPGTGNDNNRISYYRTKKLFGSGYNTAVQKYYLRSPYNAAIDYSSHFRFVNTGGGIQSTDINDGGIIICCNII